MPISPAGALQARSALVRAKAAANLGFIGVQPSKITAPPKPRPVAAPAPTSLGLNQQQAGSTPAANLTPQNNYQASVRAILQGMGLGQNVQSFVPPTDYQGEIADAPEYGAGLQARTGAQDAAAQAARLAYQQAIIGSGIIPDQSGLPPGLQGFQNVLDQSTIDAARGNQFSTQAQLTQARDQAQAALPYQLAGRGVARSGAATQRTNAIGKQYELGSSQALASLLDSLRGTSGAYGEALSQADLNFENIKQGIATRLAATTGYNQPTQNFDLQAVLDALGGLGGQGNQTDQVASRLPVQPSAAAVRNAPPILKTPAYKKALAAAKAVPLRGKGR